MKISYNWLKQFINLDAKAEETAELLTDLGLEVEGLSSFESIPGGLQGVVVGHVLTCVQHPNADRLKLTTVDLGTGEPVQIVCGAPNVAKGQKVPVATIGTTLYTAEGEAFKIKKGKIRGEESHGMICAEDELGLGTSHDGIMILEDSLKVGTPCAEIFEIENDTVFEIGLTPNRSDAMSHFGVARDLQSGLIQRKQERELITPPLTNFKINERSLKIDVAVENNTLAPRYCGLTISNLIVEPSPTWLQNRLKAIGLSPINNVVDATNYVLHDLGQPLHAFDASKVKGNKIIVKTLAKGTKFTTLDGVERELHEEDLMICNAEKPMCIAGVFGGLHSGVSENTTSIFLESAYFNPVFIRKTAKRHGLSTDASFRFERGIDIENVEAALRRAALLICEIAGGDVTSDVIDLYPNKVKPAEVFLNFDKVQKLVGQEIPREEIKSILTSLDIKVMNVTEAGIGLIIPPYRTDVQRDVDVIEEILRVYGYNNIAFTKKLNASIATSSKFEDHKLQNVIGDYLANQSFFEILTNSLTNPEYAALLNSDNDEAVTMLNPLSNDLASMRQSMLFSGLEAISYNTNRKNQNLKFFEFGKTYVQRNGKRTEEKHLSLFVTGKRSEANWLSSKQKNDFFFLKTMVENILKRLTITNVQMKPTKNIIFSEAVTLISKDVELVSFGVVGGTILKKFGLKNEVLFADFNWDTILKTVSKEDILVELIPKFPEVKRDFALLVNDSISFSEIHDMAFQTEKSLLKNVNLFDVYTGNKLPKGKKSYAVSFTLQNDKNTLTDKQIDKIMGKFQQRYEKELGAELR